MEMIKNRLYELANKTYFTSKQLHTNFLSIAEQEYTKNFKFDGVNSVLYGGEGVRERKIFFTFIGEFNKNNCGIVLLKLTPKSLKFSEKLTHRDYLGMIMHLGIDESSIGDLLIKDNVAYLYCLEKVYKFIICEAKTVKHTDISVEMMDINYELQQDFIEKHLNVSSIRIDCVIAKLYNLSRKNSLSLFELNNIFLNEKVQNYNSYNLKKGDIISVRGYGKFIFSDFSEKDNGKFSINLLIYN